MDQNKTGGAAFPELKSSYGNAQGSVDYRSTNGMTLLDYFAAKALPEILRQLHAVSEGPFAFEKLNEAARLSYGAAAEMLEVRKYYTSKP